MLMLTSWPSPPEVPVVSSIPNFDKAVHALLYGVAGFLLYRAVAWPEGRRSLWLQALTVAGAIAVWGTLDEIHQAWIPGRSMEAGDALVDTLGGFVGALVASWASRRGSPVRALESSELAVDAARADS
jgi:VanZ family protein